VAARGLFFSRPVCEATMLEEGVGDHRHERVPVQALPGSALEVIEAEFFFHLLMGQLLFAGRMEGGRGLTTRQYARLVQEWVASIGFDPAKFGTHSLRRTKAVLIYRRTGNLRAVQLLLGHSKIESTVRYLGIEVDDAIEIDEKIDI
jgi:integrase